MNLQLLLIFSFFVFCAQIQVQGGIHIERRTDPNNCTAHCCGPRTGPMQLNEQKIMQDSCSKAKCEEDRSILYRSCSPKKAHPSCYNDRGDSSKPYPECCPQIHC